ncbi:MAG: hypothetical protein Kow009_00660 [Spirochaetales bacterium]
MEHLEPVQGLNPSRIYLTPEAEHLPSVNRALRSLGQPDYRIVTAPAEIPPEHQNQGTLFITSYRGQTVNKCPGSRGHLCCNYLTVDLYLGCSIGCTYCIMKSYLNFSPLTVYADPTPSLQRIRALAQRYPQRILRVGTGETGDSLLLDPLFELSRDLIEGVSDLPNVYLELKTKTTHTDHLLGIPQKGNAIIAFSLNAEEIRKTEEGTSASMEQRIEAAGRAARAGFGLAFHFDPIIRFEGWKERYLRTIEMLKKVPTDRIHWISLGTIRFTPALRDRMEDRSYLFDEFIPCRDGKYRYLQPVRIQMYRWFLEQLSPVTDAPIYLCMESVDVWKAVYGDLPMKIETFRDIFQPIPCHTG